jgi:hypothetical protein
MTDFEDSVRTLWDRLAAINGIQWQIETRLERHRKTLEQAARKKPSSTWRYGAGANLVIRDLTEVPSDGWARYYPVAGFGVRGDAYLELVEPLISRQAAWSVAQAYEAFETYLKDHIATILNSDSRVASANGWERITKVLNKRKGLPSSGSAWREFIRSIKLRNDEILDYLELWSSDLANAVTKNNRSIDLRVWYSAVSEVRHAVTHSDLKIKKGQLRKLTPAVEATIRQCFDGNDEKGEYVLTPSRKQAHAAIVCFAEYGYLVFKSAGQRLGYNWKVLT